MAKYIDLYHNRPKAGQPPKYSPEELLEAFHDFVGVCKKNVEIPTIPGFKVYLGIDNRTYYNYEQKEEYIPIFCIITNALEHNTLNTKYKHMSDVRVKALLQRYHKYADKQVAENNNMNTDIDLSKLSYEQLQAIKKCDSYAEIMKIVKGDE